MPNGDIQLLLLAAALRDAVFPSRAFMHAKNPETIGRLIAERSSES